jgi:hypothetical protein
MEFFFLYRIYGSAIDIKKLLLESIVLFFKKIE